MSTPNRGGRPPKPDGNHDHIGFKTTRQLAGKFRSTYPEGERSEPFQAFLAWLMWEPGAKMPRRPPRASLPPSEIDSEQVA